MTLSTLPRRGLAAQCRIPTPLGPLTAAATAAGLCGLWFDGQAHHPGPIDAPDDPDHPVLRATRQALAAYFGPDAQPPKSVQPSAAPRTSPTTLPPLDLHGTPFQRSVWQALLRIGPGHTRQYAQVAEAIGSPKAVRAVGAAIGRNPVSVLVPCHRVLGRDGSLTGYAGGLDRKRALLQREGVALA